MDGAASIATWPKAVCASRWENGWPQASRSAWSAFPATLNFRTCISPSGSTARWWTPLRYEALPDVLRRRPLDLGRVNSRTNQIPAREILNFGFSGIAPTMDLVESGEAPNHPLTPAIGRAGGLRPRYRHAGGRPANAYASGSWRRPLFRIQGAGARARQSPVFHLVRKKTEGGCLDAGTILPPTASRETMRRYCPRHLKLI